MYIIKKYIINSAVFEQNSIRKNSSYVFEWIVVVCMKRQNKFTTFINTQAEHSSKR